MKAMSSIIATRLTKYQEEIGLQEQNGFSTARGCVDGTASIKIALQNLNAAGQEAFVLFVDLVKAFDSVNREMLWKILAKLGIPESLISVIQKMHNDIEIKCNVNDVIFTIASRQESSKATPLQQCYSTSPFKPLSNL